MFNDKIFILVDCNNFFVSCERVFNPKLKNHPVAVLSNNDGCMVARSNEVKKLGIKMGTPAFKVKDLIEKYDIKLFSSNFILYGDMSHRVMVTLEDLCPNVEIYSIDEAFLEVSNLIIKDLYTYGQKIKDQVYRNTGIPVSVGIARTKTLAKIATEVGKLYPEFNGVVNLVDEPDIDSYLEKIEVGDIWGVGRKYSEYLFLRGVKTAKDFKNWDKKHIRQKMTVQGERTYLELNGTSCIPLNKSLVPKKCIASTRSFGRYVTTLSEMEEAVANYTATAAEKLRKQNSTTNFIQVFLLTNMHNKKHPQYSNSITLKLLKPTAYTPDLIRYARKGINMIFKPGYKYKKAGVLFFGIQPEDLVQLDMLVPDNPAIRMEQRWLMETLDKVNHQWGKDTVKFAAQGMKKKWKMKNEKRSDLFTTRFDQLLKVT